MAAQVEDDHEEPEGHEALRVAHIEPRRAIPAVPVQEHHSAIIWGAEGAEGDLLVVVGGEELGGRGG